MDKSINEKRSLAMMVLKKIKRETIVLRTAVVVEAVVIVALAIAMCVR